jgi:hypothetical protein
MFGIYYKEYKILIHWITYKSNKITKTKMKKVNILKPLTNKLSKTSTTSSSVFWFLIIWQL